MPPLPILIGAAVIDSVNPCAFGVLIFLLAYLSKTTKHKHKFLSRGMVYILGVFLTYLFAGLLLMPFISSLSQVSLTLYILIGLIVVVAGLLEIKDFFWYGRGPSLTLLPGASARLKTYAKHISSSLPSAFFLGVFVAVVELPCTGAVYLAILSMMSLVGTNAQTTTLLILYNLIFVLPLFVILLLVSQGVNQKKLEDWRQKNRKYMRLAIGFLLLVLGAWMLHSALL